MTRNVATFLTSRNRAFELFADLLLAVAVCHLCLPPSLFAQKKKAEPLQARQVSASEIVPPKEQIHQLQTDPANSFRLFAATGQGLEISENGGRSWSVALIDGKHDEVFALAVHPARPDTLFAGRRDGFWRSEDGGQSWTAWSYPGSVPLSIAIAKGQPNTLYLATSRRGVYKSTDGGNQWTEVNRGLPEARAGGRTEEIHTLVVDPSDSNIAYAASARYGIYRTVDGGTSWHEFNPGLSSARPILPPRLVFDPDNPRRLYLAFNERIHSHLIKPRLYVLSENQKWLPVEAILPSNFYILDLVVDRANRALQLWGDRAIWQLPLPGKERSKH